MLDARRRASDRRRRRRGRPRRLGRPVPDRRLPDRLGHVVEHERQRGASPRWRPSGSVAPVHPNDDVNAPQSSNDLFPSAIHVAATQRRRQRPDPGARRTSRARSRRKASEFATVVKSGRTHLMDATPVTLGQEFGGYAAQVRYGVERLHAALPRVGELPLGGTAVGTGINAPAGLRRPRSSRELARETGPAAHRGARPLRGAGRARRAGRDLRRAAHDRGRR